MREYQHPRFMQDEITELLKQSQAKRRRISRLLTRKESLTTEEIQIDASIGDTKRKLRVLLKLIENMADERKNIKYCPATEIELDHYIKMCFRTVVALDDHIVEYHQKTKTPLKRNEILREAAMTPVVSKPSLSF